MKENRRTIEYKKVGFRAYALIEINGVKSWRSRNERGGIEINAAFEEFDTLDDFIEYYSSSPKTEK